MQWALGESTLWHPGEDPFLFKTQIEAQIHFILSTMHKYTCTLHLGAPAPLGHFKTYNRAKFQIIIVVDCAYMYLKKCCLLCTSLLENII